MTPPEACPNSALYPLVSTENSVMASREGWLYWTITVYCARGLFDETPSSWVPYAAACPPPSAQPVVPPRFLASDVSDARSKLLRIWPLTTRGSWSTRVLFTEVDITAFS